jgi:hypothetical protein
MISKPTRSGFAVGCLPSQAGTRLVRSGLSLVPSRALDWIEHGSGRLGAVGTTHCLPLHPARAACRAFVARLQDCLSPDANAACCRESDGRAGLFDRLENDQCRQGCRWYYYEVVTESSERQRYQATELHHLCLFLSHGPWAFSR